MNNYQKNLYAYGEKLGIKLPFPPIEPKLLALFFAVSIYRVKFNEEIYKTCRHKLSSFDRKCLAEFVKDLNPFELIESLEEAKGNSVKAACFEVLSHLEMIPESDEYWQDLSKRFYNKVVETDLSYYTNRKNYEEEKYYFCANITSLEEFSNVILSLEKGVVLFYGKFPAAVDEKEFECFDKWLKKVGQKVLFIRELNPKVPEKLSKIEGVSSGAIIRTDNKNLLVVDKNYSGPRLNEKDVDAVIGDIKANHLEKLAPFISYQSGNFVMNHNKTIIKGIPFNQVASI